MYTKHFKEPLLSMKLEYEAHAFIAFKCSEGMCTKKIAYSYVAKLNVIELSENNDLQLSTGDFSFDFSKKKKT